MKRAADHDKYLGIIHSIAQAEALEKQDKQKEENKTVREPTCLNCSKRKTCKKFNGKMTYSGTYSIGGDTKQNICDKWSEKKDFKNDPKKTKNLLKQFSKLNVR